MSFNRLEYDDCHYKKRMQESTDPCAYQLYLGKHEHGNACPCQEPKTKDCTVTPVTRTEVENELYNLNRPASLCPGKKYNRDDPKNFKHSYHTPWICEKIYHLTPTNMKKPTTTGVTEDDLDMSKCCKN